MRVFYFPDTLWLQTEELTQVPRLRPCALLLKASRSQRLRWSSRGMVLTRGEEGRSAQTDAWIIVTLFTKNFTRAGRRSNSVRRGNEQPQLKPTFYVYHIQQLNYYLIKNTLRLHYQDKSFSEERETNKMQLILCLLPNFYLNMFRASLCPSSGEQECALPHMVFCTVTV